MRIQITAALFLLGGSSVIAAHDPVSVPAKFDGRWSLEAATETGACPAMIHVQIDVSRGAATVTGSVLYTVEGGISSAGAVHGKIATVTARALVDGTVEGNGIGRGAWRTQEGSLLTCAGSWTARRA